MPYKFLVNDYPSCWVEHAELIWIFQTFFFPLGLLILRSHSSVEVGRTPVVFDDAPLLVDVVPLIR